MVPQLHMKFRALPVGTGLAGLAAVAGLMWGLAPPGGQPVRADDRPSAAPADNKTPDNKTDPPPSAAAARPVTRPKWTLTRPVREALVRLAERGPKQPYTVLVASAPGRNADVARRVAGLGGKILSQIDAVDFLAVRVTVRDIAPLGDFDGVEVLDIEKFGDVAVGGVFPPGWGQANYFAYYGAPAGPPGPAPRLPQIKPSGPQTPADNPYLPTRDMGVPQFLAANPTFDGRGVTIAVVEDVPNLLAPELTEPAITLDGRPTRKLAGIYPRPSGGDRAEPDDPVRMGSKVTVREGRFEAGGAAYSAPAQSGAYRFGLFDATSLKEALATHYRSPDALPGRNSLYAVLWDEKSGRVWVDTNQDRNFADEAPLRDYNTHFDVGTWRSAGPDTPADRRFGFAVGVDSTRRLVHVHVGFQGHTTEMISAAVGRKFFGGAMDGVAPGARVVVVPVSDTGYGGYAGLIEALVRAAELPSADLVCVAAYADIGPADLCDGTAFNRVVDRVVEKYRKPVIWSAGNSGPGLSTTSQTTSGAILVGGYIHRDTWAANYGTAGAGADYLHFMSARGPSLDGRVKPDLVAPISCLSATSPLFRHPNVQRVLGDGAKIPPGYAVATGTSFSSPMAAGAAALLLSAAKQKKGVPHDAERVRWALLTSARFLDSYGAHEQGCGLIDVAKAWEALQRAPAPVQIDCRGPVRLAAAPWGELSSTGPGLYEREGWVPGASGTRRLVFRRSSGPAGPVTYHLAWVGNDGTFAAAETLTLPLDRETPLEIKVTPAAAGAHSAILRLTDGRSGPPLHQALVTVVAADDVPPPGEKLEVRGDVEWLRSGHHFFRVPEKAAALTVAFTLAQGAGVRVSLRGPDGHGPPCAPSVDGRTTRATVQSLVAGVWELVVDNGRPASGDISRVPPSAARYTLSVSVSTDPAGRR
jgi:hypothetical protein